LSHAQLEEWAPCFTRSTDQVEADLRHYEALLRKWQPAQNLVSRETLDELWPRHFIDSLQLLPLIYEAKTFLDLGSGGGFPALPLAIALKDDNRTWILSEANARKTSFLRTVARELQLPVKVTTARAESLDSRETQPDVFTSRALAPLTQLCAWIAPLMQPGSRAVLHKGREYGEEIAAARVEWLFDVLETPSRTHPASVILTLRNIERR
jgi:16S rRNA (guanine527-N7)-methyltransferase